MDSLFSLIFYVLVPLFMIFVILTVRKNVMRQKQVMDVQTVSVERQKESLALIQKQLETQEKILALLEQIKDGKASS